MDSSILYCIPDLLNPSILNKRISKSRSLSDLENVLKTPEDSIVNRRYSFSGTLTMNTSLNSASVVEAFLGSFKMLQEPQVPTSLLKHETSHSKIPATINLHQNVNGCQNVFKPTKFEGNFNGNNVSKASTSDAVSLNDFKKFTLIKPLLFEQTKGHKNDIFSANPDTSSKTQNNMYTFVTSSPQISTTNNSKVRTKPESFLSFGEESPTDSKNKLEDSISKPKKCKPEIGNSLVEKKTPKRKEESIPSIAKVASLVFFDLETTGLAFEIGKKNVQITEVSMIAMNRKEFEESTFEDLRDIRIIQKLCLCSRPRSNISSSAAKVTGLNNENLKDQNPFERNAAETINFFLSHLPKPVCLLAHNGNHYDFPLLKAEFSRLSMSLPSDILIADTLKAFRVLGVPVFPPEKKISESVKYTKRGQVSYSLSNLHLYLFNKKPIGSHSSEGDCIALAKVCHRMKDLILLWVDENCTTFDYVSPMW